MTPLTLDYRAVADVLSVSERTVRRLTKSGELPAVAIAGSTRVRTADLAAYVEALPPVNGTEGADRDDDRAEVLGRRPGRTFTSPNCSAWSRFGRPPATTTSTWRPTSGSPSSSRRPARRP